MPRINATQQRERERQAWAYRAEGMTHERIAELIGAERSTITKMLARLADRALGELTEDVSEEKMAQVSILRRIVDESMQAWERSKNPEKTVTKRAPVIEDAEKNHRRRGTGRSDSYLLSRVIDSDGDPRYLDMALKALGEIRKVLGLNAPTGIDVTTGGKTIDKIEVIEIVKTYEDTPRHDDAGE